MFIYTKHAIEKIDTLGMEKRDVENAVRKGMKWKERSSEKWHAQMAGIEIVFMREGKNIFIITAYFAGRLK